MCFFYILLFSCFILYILFFAFFAVPLRLCAFAGNSCEIEAYANATLSSDFCLLSSFGLLFFCLNQTTIRFNQFIMDLWGLICADLNFL